MRLRSNKTYSSESENSTMEHLGDVENLGEGGQGNSVGGVEEISSIGTHEEEPTENNREMGNQREAGPSQENLSTDYLGAC